MNVADVAAHEGAEALGIGRGEIRIGDAYRGHTLRRAEHAGDRRGLREGRARSQEVQSGRAGPGEGS